MPKFNEEYVCSISESVFINTFRNIYPDFDLKTEYRRIRKKYAPKKSPKN